MQVFLARCILLQLVVSNVDGLSSTGAPADSAIQSYLRSAASTDGLWHRRKSLRSRKGPQPEDAEAQGSNAEVDPEQAPSNQLELSMFERKQGLVDIYTDPSDRQVLLFDLANVVNSTTHILVTATWSRGTFSDTDGQNTIMHEPVDGTEATMLRFDFCQDGSVDVIQPQLALRTTDRQTKNALKSGAWPGWLDNLKIVPTMAKDTMIVDGTAFLANGFYAQGWAFGEQILSFRVQAVKSYPKNILVTSAMQLSDGAGGKVPVEISFSIVALPSTPMPARPSDDRLGFFSVDYTDMGQHTPEDEHQLSASIDKATAVIQRFDIHAEEDKQIRFYIDPTVPRRWRQYFKQGIEAWNEAFALAGHPNTMHAVLPTDDDWPVDYDRDDARYSTISWSIDVDMTYALGLAKVDPRSGQILKSDIIVTSGWVHSWLNDVEAEAPEIVQTSDSINTFRLEARQRQSRRHRRGGHMKKLGLHGGNENPPSRKNNKRALSIPSFIAGGAQPLSSERAGDAFANSTTQLRAIRMYDQFQEISQEKWEKVVGAGLRSVVMHETGHSLGLRHNFKGSTGISKRCLENATCTAEKGLSVSIMDYMPINVFAIGQPEGSRPDMFMAVIGEYDKKAIQYGYTDVHVDNEALQDSLDTAPALTKILESAEGLPMCTDEDLESGRDPSCKQHDLSNNPVEYYRTILGLISKQAKNLLSTSVSPGDSYTHFGEAMQEIIERVAYIGSELVSWIGGLDTKPIHRKEDGQHTEMKGVDIVPFEVQKLAMHTVADLVKLQTFNFMPEDGTSHLLLSRVGEIGVQAVDISEQTRRLQLFLVDALTSTDVFLRLKKATGVNSSSLSQENYVKTLMDRLVIEHSEGQTRAADVAVAFVKNLKKVYFSRCSDEDTSLPMGMILNVRSELVRVQGHFANLDRELKRSTATDVLKRSSFVAHMNSLLLDLDLPCSSFALAARSPEE